MTSFAALGYSCTYQVLNTQGIKVATPVQEKAIPAIFKRERCNSQISDRHRKDTGLSSSSRAAYSDGTGRSTGADFDADP